MTKILMIGSQHGNERLGEELYEYMKSHRPLLLTDVEYLVANRRAHQQNVRYVESDMNRSYNGRKSTYEERRATNILKYINDSEFDLVLDMHTTSCKQPPSLIVASISPENIRYIQASSISNIVLIKHAVVDASLNGHCPLVVSVEVNRELGTKVLADICDDIERYCQNKECLAERNVYEVTELLKKTEMSENEAEGLINFEQSERGFYPVLVGEESYKKQTEYLGFKAHKRYKFKV